MTDRYVYNLCCFTTYDIKGCGCCRRRIQTVSDTLLLPLLITVIVVVADNEMKRHSAAGVCGRPDVKVADGIGYLGHPFLCDHYLQCYLTPDGTLTAVTRHCGPGRFWNRERARCDDAWDVTCAIGR